MGLISRVSSRTYRNYHIPIMEDVKLDALPYYDKLTEDPKAKKRVEALIEAECSQFRPKKSYIADVLPPANYEDFLTPILKSEYERMEKKEPLNALDMDRYVLPAPPAGQQQDLSAWETCIDNSSAQLEHQSIRLENLILLEEYGCAAYRVNNDYLQQMVNSQRKILEEARKSLHDIHWARKSNHDNLGLKLDESYNGWKNKIADNYQLEEELIKMRKMKRTLEGELK